MELKKYTFASVRGADFVIEGLTPLDAWENLCKREQDNGTLWRACDEHRNNLAVSKEGFKKLKLMGGFVAYKEGVKNVEG